MKPNMLFDEAGDKVVTVIVTRLHTNSCRVFRLLTGGNEVPSLQLLAQKIIGHPLINQYWGAGGRLQQELGRVILMPLACVLPQIMPKRFLAPGAGRLIHNR